ncbi:MAG: hypothetical protein A3J66_04370 [Candidatus Magasanikbacteria bacterium RIFCSPHIGHO2_02_FULL_47_14]|uniref:Iron transporter n=1 Tax=Candidatus Magasanikbacteria bacterium RIFCSPHIGHO2_02_FULL_47_14 TaxID=1798680 RepID=A0A1F6M4J3_9BACT|nr:MAG: hypothetical protein A3J66_04370 [Candidatus Magasanikbacteria bacterium RIFCSPHIGHO2_02_FULL_47_14]
MHIERNPNYIHHKDPNIARVIREVVFGMEDGMVSTFGAVTGIAAAVQDHYIVVLSGLVVIGVESISMAIGSYVSNKSERAIDERKLDEERAELKQFPEAEKEELVGMYVKDGWTQPLAEKMAEEASQKRELFLQEMAYRELKVFPDHKQEPLKSGVAMGVSYIIGGAIPLIPYLLFSNVSTAIVASLVVTPVGLMGLGALVTRYSKQPWVKIGVEMVLLGGTAAAVGYFVGQMVEKVILG